MGPEVGCKSHATATGDQGRGNGGFLSAFDVGVFLPFELGTGLTLPQGTGLGLGIGLGLSLPQGKGIATEGDAR